MNKKNRLIITLLAVAIVLGSGINIQLNSATGKQKFTELTLTNIEGQADLWEDLQEWWDRNDYDCVNVVCFTISGLWWYSLEAIYVGAGQGSVPHEWNCAGC